MSIGLEALEGNAVKHFDERSWFRKKPGAPVTFLLHPVSYETSYPTKKNASQR